MTALRRIADEPEPEAWIAGALPWAYEASLPYMAWLLGGAGPARAALESWMARPTSEVYIGRASVLLDGEQQVGGFIALPGAELPACRRADTLAAVAEASDRDALLERMRSASGLFAEVSPEELYLARLGVEAGRRGRGLGSRLLREYLEHGAREGFRRFRLDVSADNEAAIGLYRSQGFEVASESGVPDGEIDYVALALERGG